MVQVIEVVLFDVGGVLVDVRGLREFYLWTQSPEEARAKWLYSPAVRRFESGKTDPAAFASEFIVEWKLAVRPEAFLSEFRDWISGPLPGAIDLLSRVSPRVKRATLSNCNELHWPRIMDQLGLSEHIQTHFASHLTGKVKPDREAFEHATTRLGHDPGSILFLDDNQDNVDAARALDIDAYRVEGPAAAAAVLEARGLLL